MDYAQSINVLGDFFKLTFVENPGMAFGIDVGVESKLFLSLFSLVASGGILYYLYKMRDKHIMLRLALALILGGAVGNLIDRTFYGLFYDYAPLFYGRVVDFLNVDFFDFTIFGRTYDRWPIFNIADSAVSIGVVLLIFLNHKESGDEGVSEVENETAENMEPDNEENKHDEILKNVPDNNGEKAELGDTGGEKERKA